MTEILFTTLYYVLEVISWAVIIRALLSWVPNSANTKYADILYTFTEPVLLPVRTLINKMMQGKQSMIDFSTIALLLIVMVIQRIIQPYT